MPRVSLVGDGHGGSEDYATLTAWWATERLVDYGDVIEAQCLGSVGSFAPNTASVNGALIYTLGVQYDGTNQTSLASGTNFNLDTGFGTVGAPVTFRDFYIENSGAFNTAFRFNSEYVTAQRIRAVNSGSSSDAFLIDTALANSSISNSVFSGGSDTCMSRFGDGCVVNNCLFFGSADKGVESASSTATMLLTDCFSFNNTGADYDTTELTLATCASEDTSGTVTGYGSAELVNFASNDFRTKSTSFLATAGSGGSFIGAFLEAGAPPAETSTVGAGLLNSRKLSRTRLIG